MSTIIDLNRVIEKTTLSRRVIYNYVEAGTFPAPIKVGARRIAFVEAEVDAWIEKRIADSRANQAHEVAA